MIWRSNLVLLTSLAALTLPAYSVRAEINPLLLAQSPATDPGAATDTGRAVPDFGAASAESPLQDVSSEEQVEQIKTLQRELQNRGYYEGPIDGIYGPGTDRAVRTLRGQEGGQVSSELSTQTDASDAPTPAAETAEPLASDEPSEAGDQNDVISESSAVQIGEQVSPETGAEPGGAAEVEDSSAAAPSSSGQGALLWPGIALIAALGSFGIGFVLANRGQAKDDEDIDSPWGKVPNEVSTVSSNGVSQSPLNGTTNGVTANGGVDGPYRHDDALSVMASAESVGATTRLVKADVIDELVANLQVADPAKRRKAIWELGQRGNSSAVQHLVNGMVDADSKEKSLILAALSEIGIRSLKPMNRALAIALQDDNPDVRKNAIRDLTRVYDLVSQISQMLGHATEDEDPEVRRTAEWALGQLNRIREAPKLKASLNTLEASRSATDLLPDEAKNIKN